MYTPLHLVPPSVPGLISSIENKYKINASNIRFLYRSVLLFLVPSQSVSTWVVLIAGRTEMESLQRSTTICSATTATKMSSSCRFAILFSQSLKSFINSRVFHPGDGDGESVWYGGHDGVRHHTLRNPVCHGGKLPLGDFFVVVRHRSIQPLGCLGGRPSPTRGLDWPWAGLRWGS